MAKNIFVFLAMMVLLTSISCTKDEDRAILLDSPAAPTLTVPSTNLVLKRTEAANMLTFTGDSADYGYKASVSYILEAVLASGNFNTPFVIATSSSNLFKMTVGDLNSKLLTMPLPADQSTAIKMRVTSTIIESVPKVHSSEVAMSVTTYGYPKLVLSTTPAQNIFSVAGDGKYTGFVKLTEGTTFTVTDPDANKTYGGTNGTLSVGGAAFSVTKTGWYAMNVNTVAMTYSITANMIGIIGSATPNDWNTPDTKMDYNAAQGYWVVTVDLKASAGKDEFKFRKNDSWDWNLGGDINNLTEGGSNIKNTVAGNYTVKLYIDSKPWRCTLVKN